MLWKGTIAVAVIAALLFVDRSWDVASLLEPEAVHGLLETTGPLAPFVFMGVMAATIVVSPIPSLPLDIAAGAYFGPWLGTLYAALGALAGSMISFSIARLLGREFVERLLGGHISFCSECSDRLLTWIVLASRLVPVASFDLISYGAGLTKMTLRNFSVATFLGMLPLTFVYVYWGRLLVSGTAPLLVGGALLVGLFLVLPRLIEEYNLFGMRDVFRHRESEGAG